MADGDYPDYVVSAATGWFVTQIQALPVWLVEIPDQRGIRLVPFFMRSASVVLTAAALAAATMLAAVPASAATRTWTISHGGAVSATTKSFTLDDITAGGSLTCKSSAVKAKLKSGKHLSGANAGALTSLSVTGCDLDGLPITIKAAHLPWHLNLVSYNSAKGVTTGTVTGVHLTLAVPDFACTGVVDGSSGKADNGSVEVTYTNKTGKLATLKTGGKLRLYDVSKNCDGFVKNRDSIAIIASYTVTPKQKITSP